MAKLLLASKLLAKSSNKSVRHSGKIFYVFVPCKPCRSSYKKQWLSTLKRRLIMTHVFWGLSCENCENICGPNVALPPSRPQEESGLVGLLPFSLRWNIFPCRAVEAIDLASTITQINSSQRSWLCACIVKTCQNLALESFWWEARNYMVPAALVDWWGLMDCT